MKQWIKATMITGPLLLAGTVYAFAASGSNGVTFTVHPSQSVTQQTPTQNQSNGINNETTNEISSQTTKNPTVQNPFLVASGQTTTSSSNENQIQVVSHSLSITMIQHLLVQANSVDGKITLNFTQNGDGNVHLDGNVNNNPIQLSGEDAITYLQGVVFDKWGLQNVIQVVLSNGSGEWNVPQGLEVEHLNIQLKNHVQINLVEHSQHSKTVAATTKETAPAIANKPAVKSTIHEEKRSEPKKEKPSMKQHGKNVQHHGKSDDQQDKNDD